MIKWEGEDVEAAESLTGRFLRSRERTWGHSDLQYFSFLLITNPKKGQKNMEAVVITPKVQRSKYKAFLRLFLQFVFTFFANKDASRTNNWFSFTKC